MLRKPSARTAEEQDIPVGVPKRETAEPVVCIRQWLDKLEIPRGKLGCQGVRIRDGNECVPAGDALLRIPGAVGHRRYANGFQQELGTAPANDAEENVVGLRTLEGDLKPQAVPVNASAEGTWRTMKKGDMPWISACLMCVPVVRPTLRISCKRAVSSPAPLSASCAR